MASADSCPIIFHVAMEDAVQRELNRLAGQVSRTQLSTPLRGVRT
jgi:hypothetical protein